MLFGLPSTEAADEDCFQCNVWVPYGEPPANGWPVLIFIHGGFLQFGTPNSFSAAALLGETDFNAIIVMPAYRLNVIGFLYSSELEQDAASVGETVGNHGFWDQRMALEWIKENIGLFGGNGSQITLAGYSAGAYSVCYQLTYDLTLPETESIIKRACIWSNSFTVQPKNPALAQSQFNQLLSALNIPISLPASEKLSRLRSTPSSTLISAAASIDLHEFRPTTDNAFIPNNLFHSLDNGTFARTLVTRNIHIITGECRDEHFLYGTYRRPEKNTLGSLRARLLADYPRPIVDALMKVYYPNGKLPAGCTDWTSDAFGRIYADMQIHHMQRGFIYALTNPITNDTSLGAKVSKLIHRYRMEYRLKCADVSAPPEWGVTHATDQYIWFWGNGQVVLPEEKEIIKDAVIGPFIRFVHGEQELGWGTNEHREMRTLRPDGRVEIWWDGLWDEAVRTWRALREIAEFGEGNGGARL
ncbi:putative carboxylesterase [Aspergillus mulundensis]|uniref:Carboxylic ester hydrolase n=1 Tax=Aspergillus mulundensis TaxID=1810919 RepID=A0A3D8Q8D6_9EURO|nr:Carboxylic ester hydrolase [Aspergillus mulundensis]RDW57930.1 Carboxylic ester hydrolase [Aspergillus mulundensis]